MSFDLSHEVLRTIRKIIRAVDIQSKKIFNHSGMTSPQLIALKEISNNPQTTTSQLANRISISQPTATAIIDKLVAKELVVRERDETDKRKWILNLTPKGQYALLHAPSLLQESFLNTFNRLPDWHQTSILANLQHVADMMHASKIDADPMLISTAEIASEIAAE